MFEDRCYDRDNSINTSFSGDNMNVDFDANITNQEMFNKQAQMPANDMQQVISSPVKERCIHKTIIHDVPQDWVFM